MHYSDCIFLFGSFLTFPPKNQATNPNVNTSINVLPSPTLTIADLHIQNEKVIRLLQQYPQLRDLEVEELVRTFPEREQFKSFMQDLSVPINLSTALSIPQLHTILLEHSLQQAPQGKCHQRSFLVVGLHQDFMVLVRTRGTHCPSLT